MTFARNALIILVLVYCALMLGLYSLQRHLLYHPSHSRLAPEAAGLEGVRVLNLAVTPGEKLIAWYAPPRSDEPVILFLHGNGGDITGRAERFAYYQHAGFGVMFLSYRGYGESTGSPSEAGLVADAEVAYDWLGTQGISASRIVLVGESLGTGVAVQLAARRSAAAIALEAPFTSTADVARLTYWWLPVGLLMKDQFRSADFIGEIHAPVLFIHGTGDRLVPMDLGQKLFAMANEPKEFVAIPDGTHVSIFSEEAWRREVDFFRRRAAK